MTPIVASPTRFINPESTKLKNKILATFAVLALAMPIGMRDAQAQSAPLPLGTVWNVNFLGTSTTGGCPSVGFPTSSLSNLNCYSATVSCPNTNDTTIYFAYATPPGSQGTIVIFQGAGGTIAYDNTPPDENYGVAFYNGGVNGLGNRYEVVWTAWCCDWENTNAGPSGQPQPPLIFNIQTAACRPATFLNYVRYHSGSPNLYTGGGMCAHGSSGGAGAVAYALAWYGAASYLDKVELLAGPAFSDIEQGCEGPPPPKVTICPPGQFGCQGWPGSNSLDMEYPTYINGAEHSVGAWTDLPSCGTSQTSGSNDTTWLRQSIVETATGQPSFTYASTAMVGWLCASSNTSTYNSSSPQGEIFFEQFTQASQTFSYDVFAVYTCHEDEGVAWGTVPSLPTSPSGFTAITNDMVGLSPQYTAACGPNPGH
ncbi:MAG TPA: hypothetical protein VEF05_07915 [Terriglobales bacterium]|nr:hypothetical protein [Terriglobales bacterium]